MKIENKFKVIILLFVFVALGVLGYILITDELSNKTPDIAPLEVTAKAKEIDVQNVDLSKYNITEEDFVKDSVYKVLTVSVNGNIGEDVCMQYETDFLIATKENQMYMIEQSKGINPEEIYLTNNKGVLKARPTGYIFININNQYQIVENSQIDVMAKIVCTEDEVTDYEYFIYDTATI